MTFGNEIKNTKTKLIPQCCASSPTAVTAFASASTQSLSAAKAAGKKCAGVYSSAADCVKCVTEIEKYTTDNQTLYSCPTNCYYIEEDGNTYKCTESMCSTGKGTPTPCVINSVQT